MRAGSPPITTSTTTPMAESAIYDLMTWMSPAWPIGAFAHSGGLEWAVEQGHVTDRASTAEWIAALLDHGAFCNDCVIFVHAWRAAQAGETVRLREVAELAAALQTGFERRLEATAQGAAFRRIAVASIVRDPSRPCLGEDRSFAGLLASVDDEDLTYSVAAATLFASQAIGLRPALTAWLQGAAANLVSAAQRLVPLGQTDGQKVLRDLREPILAAAKAAAKLPDTDPFDLLGGCTLVSEIGCMAHETQYTRLFRT
jgi:urease accessory protein